jgi:hypothetical protein
MSSSTHDNASSRDSDTITKIDPSTQKAAREIGKAMRHLTQHKNRSAIVTSETVREAATKVKSKKKS